MGRLEQAHQAASKNRLLELRVGSGAYQNRLTGLLAYPPSAFRLASLPTLWSTRFRRTWYLEGDRLRRPIAANTSIVRMRSAMRFLLALTVVFGSIVCTGCKPRTAEPRASTNAGGGSSTSKTPAQPDDPAAVAVLEKAGAELQKGSSGNIVSVDLRDAGGGNAELIAAAGKLPGLQILICTGSDVNDAALLGLKGHARLERLDATSRSAIGDEGAAILATVTNLIEVNLEKSEISDAAYPHLAKLKNLKRLRAPFTKTSDVGLKALANSTQLELLDFRDCTGVSDEGILALEKLTKMRSFKVWGRQVTDASLKVIGTMTNLASLGLQDTRVSGDGGELAALKKLTDLDVFRSTFSDAGLKSVAGATGMKTLKLRDCQVTPEGLKVLSEFKNLERLDLSESQADDSTLEVISTLPKLFELELWTSKVTDEGLAHLVKLPLKTLSLEDVYDITDAGMPHIGKIKTLESLTLSKTGVTDDGLKELAGLENLRELLLDNTAVSKKGVNELKAKLPKLDKVSF